MSVSLNSKKLSYSIGKMNVALDLNFKTYLLNYRFTKILKNWKWTSKINEGIKKVINNVDN